MYARFMCIYAWKYQDVEKEFCRFIYQNFKKEYYNCIPNITIFLTGHTKKKNITMKFIEKWSEWD